MSRFVIGVDGGTTKTIALVADEHGCVLGAGREGNSNRTGPDVTAAINVVLDAVQHALDQAGLSRAQIALGVFCLAGADWPEDYEQRRAVLQRQQIAQQVIVRNDSVAGWRAGTREAWGVVISAGTGTNTCIITPGGCEWCYGYYARYGGAASIVEEAIHAVLRQADGRGIATTLTDIVLGQLCYPSPEALLRALVARRLDWECALALCPHVFQAAAAGDEAAVAIVVKQGLALAEYAVAVIRRYELCTKAFDVVLSGSLFKGEGPWLVDTITQAVHQVAPGARIVRPRFEPAVGAVLLAYDALGVCVTEQVVANLARTAPRADFFHTGGSRSQAGS